MKSKYIPHVIIIMLVLVLSSCKDKLFDFNLQNIEADGEWGLPVCRGTIQVGDLFSNLDDMNGFHPGTDGSITYVFDNEVKDIVSLHNLFRINNQMIDTMGTVEISRFPELNVFQSLQFNINTPDFHLKLASIKTGSLSLSFSVSSTDFDYSTEYVTGNIKNEQGDSLRLTFDNTHSSYNFSLSNYTIQPDENGNVIFSAHILVPDVTSVTSFQYFTHIEMTDLSIFSVLGQFNTISRQYETRTGFNLHLSDFQLNNIQLNNAKTYIYSKNGICDINGTVNDFYMFGKNGAYVSLINSPFSFASPTSSQYVLIHTLNMPSLAYNPDIDSLGVQCDFNVNPLGFNAGDIYVDENSTLDLLFKTEIPFNISINNAVYSDTLDNMLSQQINHSLLQSIEKLTLRISYINSMPFDVIPSIEFVNSQTGETHKINLGDLQIHGGYNGIPYCQEPIYIDFINYDAQKIINADKIITNFRMSTQGHDVIINNSQSIDVVMGAKVKYSNINM